MEYLRVVWTLFRKDLRAEWRSREMLSSMLVFALLAIILFVFSFELSADLHRQAFAGTLWISLCFAGTLGLTRSFAQEQENSVVEGLLLVPVDRSAIFFAKALANWLWMMLLAVLLVPLMAFFMNLNPFSWSLLGVILLGTLGYALCGTFLAGITSRLRHRENFLPLLLFPVLLPLLLAVVRATGILLNGGNSAELITWLGMLAGYDMLFAALGLFLFEQVIAD
ncbi:MAG: ABC transporter permease [Anaerolineaceae bacterium]|jgi:heme exporter protein B|nr:ABC transporter permease [Anaerolineaceae bacterium]